MFLYIYNVCFKTQNGLYICVGTYYMYIFSNTYQNTADIWLKTLNSVELIMTIPANTNIKFSL